MWCVLCEISGDYLQVKDFKTEAEARRYAEAQEALELWDFISCYEVEV